MLPRPTETNPPDYRRAAAGKAISRARAGYSSFTLLSCLLLSTFYFLLRSDDSRHDASHSASRWDHARRVPLFLRRPRGRLRLHRGDDALRINRDLHPPDRAHPEHPGRDHWFVSILASRIFFMAALLAVRAALDSGGLSRRLP